MLSAILKKYLKPYQKPVILSFILLLAQAIASLYIPNLNADLINNGVAKGDVGYIWHIGLIMLAASTVVIIVSIWITYLASQISMRFGRDLRAAIFKQVQSFSSQELGKFGAASLITRSTNDIQQVQMLVFMSLTMMLAAPITAVGAIFMAIHTNAHLSLLLLVVVPFLSTFIGLLLRRIVPLFRIGQIRTDRLNLVLREQIAGIRVIRAFVKRRTEEERFEGASLDVMETGSKIAQTFAFMFPTVMFIFNTSSVAVIWFGGKLVETGNLQIGSLTAYLAYLMQILGSVMMGVMMSMFIPRAAASAERIQEVLTTESSISESTASHKELNTSGIVEFNNVEFRYPGAEHPILTNISFIAKPGEFTAIIGGTGSGKSTVLNLIPRFMDVTKGSILVNGEDIRNQPLETLWASFGLVPQRSLLFKGSVRDNLHYGKFNANDEEIWHALEVAQAKDFVEALPEKLDAEISQGGTNFSGGQRQRLAIARALIRKAPIYLFDDSFSALDYTTDAKLRAELMKYAKESTLIVVAQRVSTILNADQIVVLDEGKIVGIGKHHDLMQNCPTYKEIVLSQLSPEEAA